MEPTTGLEPGDLVLTKDVLYLLSYVGTGPLYPNRLASVRKEQKIYS